MITKKVSIFVLISFVSLLIVSCSNGISPTFPEKTVNNDSWLITWGGVNSDFIRAQAISPNGSIYLSTHLNYTVPPFGSDPSGSQGSSTSNLEKYDTSGNLIWSHIWEIGDSEIRIEGIMCDQDGSVFTCGAFSGTINFDPYSGKAILTAQGVTDGFLSRYDPQGNHLWTTTWGKKGVQNKSRFITLDRSGNIVIVSTGDRPDGGLRNSPDTGILSYYLSKFDKIGNLLWTVEIYRSPLTIAADSDNNTYVGGYFWGNVDFNLSNTVDEVSSIGEKGDSYITKFDSNGVYLWTKSFGVEGDDRITHMKINSSDILICMGVSDNEQIIEPENWEYHKYIFLNGLNSEGVVVWAKLIGANTIHNEVKAFAIGQNDDIFLHGVYNGRIVPDPDYEDEQFKTIIDRYYNSFIRKYDPNGNFIWTSTWTNDYTISRNISVDDSGGIYISGKYSGETEFNVAGNKIARNSDRSDLFLLKISEDDLLNPD